MKRYARNAVFAEIFGLIGFGWLLLAVAQPDGQGWSNNLFVGLVLGTMFGQVSLAAAWCALGPLPLMQRLPLSFTWLAAIVVSFGCNIARTPNPQGFSVLLVYAGGMFLQWIVLQLPLWLAVTRYGLRVGSEDDDYSASDYRDKQFGIRQIMFLTLLVALVLGVGRLMLGGLKTDASFGRPSVVWLFAFLAFSNAVVSLPLVGTVLLPRMALVATCGALLLGAFATAIELSLLGFLIPLSVVRPDEYWEISLLNVFQAAWILAVLFLLRWDGFRLMSLRKSRAGFSIS